MKSVFIDCAQFVSDKELCRPLEELGEVQYFSEVPESIDEAVARAEGADVLLFCIMQIPNEMLDRLPNLKIVQFVGTGVETFIDIEYAKTKGIKVLKIEGYGNNGVAEFAIAGIFAAARQVGLGNTTVRSGKWTAEGCEGMEISGSKVGVVGTGNIGALVAKKCHALGANVVAFDVFQSTELKDTYKIPYVSLEEIFATCDIITLHLKVNEKTAGIISKDLIESMKQRSLFVNVARAELVDNKALFQALQERRIMGALIDVYEQEPPQGLNFQGLENVVFTPHIGFYTKEASDNSIKMSVDSVVLALKGE